MKRPRVTQDHLDVAFGRLRECVEATIKKQGDGAFVGPHEALGVLTEEYHELVNAARSNVGPEYYGEVMDVAVTCVFEIASTLARAQAGSIS